MLNGEVQNYIAITQQLQVGFTIPSANLLESCVFGHLTLKCDLDLEPKWLTHAFCTSTMFSKTF